MYVRERKSTSRWGIELKFDVQLDTAVNLKAKRENCLKSTFHKVSAKPFAPYASQLVQVTSQYRIHFLGEKKFLGKVRDCTYLSITGSPLFTKNVILAVCLCNSAWCTFLLKSCLFNWYETVIDMLCMVWKNTHTS